MLLDNLLREPVSRDWPLVCLELLTWCPEAEDRQEMAEVGPKTLGPKTALMFTNSSHTFMFKQLKINCTFDDPFKVEFEIYPPESPADLSQRAAAADPSTVSSSH